MDVGRVTEKLSFCVLIFVCLNGALIYSSVEMAAIYGKIKEQTPKDLAYFVISIKDPSITVDIDNMAKQNSANNSDSVDGSNTSTHLENTSIVDSLHSTTHYPRTSSNILGSIDDSTIVANQRNMSHTLNILISKNDTFPDSLEGTTHPTQNSSATLVSKYDRTADLMENTPVSVTQNSVNAKAQVIEVDFSGEKRPEILSDWHDLLTRSSVEEKGFMIELTPKHNALNHSVPETICRNQNTWKNKHNLKVQSKLVNLTNESIKNRMAYMVDIYYHDETGMRKDLCIVDAVNGTIYMYENIIALEPINIMSYGGNEKIGKHKFSKIAETVKVLRIGQKCYLENEHVKVIDMKNKNWRNITETFSFECNKPVNDSINGAYSPALDTFYNGNMVYKMYQDWLGIDPLNGKKLTFKVHFGHQYDNAHWSGKDVIIGDGHETYYPLTSLDSLGHEASHGFTDQYSGLFTVLEPGAISESFCDIAGEATEAYAYGENDWLVGYETVKNREAHRYFKDPTLDGKSISHYTNYTKGMNRYYSNGIFNRLFYLIVNEGNLTVKAAFQIFAHANMYYWDRFSDFQDAGCDLLKSTSDLKYDKFAVSLALKVVGLDVCDTNRYIAKLRKDVQRRNIMVSSDRDTSFYFVIPLWAINTTLFIEATDYNTSIDVSVSNSGAAESNFTDTLLASEASINYVNNSTFVYLWQNLPNGKLLITLTASGNESLYNVSLRATYKCQPGFNFRNYSYSDAIFWFAECK